ncbi:MAG TPA: hypothetical protein VFH72_07025 [Candidatus Baltobacteraceae bacterium]|nr:hypothetical protein [Candidatus Baltobacteraceae bacterium]
MIAHIWLSVLLVLMCLPLLGPIHSQHSRVFWFIGLAAFCADLFAKDSIASIAAGATALAAFGASILIEFLNRRAKGA